MALPGEGEVIHGDPLDLDLVSPKEISLFDSTDSTLANSPQWDDCLFAQFVRSPSPESGRTLQDEPVTQEIQDGRGVPDSDVHLSSASAGKGPRAGQGIDAPPVKLNKVSIRLRVQPKPPPVLSETKMVLRLPVGKRRQ